MATSNDKSLEMLNTALDMEEKGKVFYDRAIATCKNKLGVEIFKALRKDEFVHIERIKKIYSSLKNNEGWNSEWTKFKADHTDLDELFTGLAKKHVSEIKAEACDLEALDVGIDFERKSVAYYEKYLRHATDSIERSFLDKMVAEEKNHEKVLVDMKFYLANPAAWFAEAEKAGFDGQ